MLDLAALAISLAVAAALFLMVQSLLTLRARRADRKRTFNRRSDEAGEDCVDDHERVVTQSTEGYGAPSGQFGGAGATATWGETSSESGSSDGGSGDGGDGD